MSDKVLITDIQKFAVNDGPGFRTNVFLKGCALKCQWCHNPETIAPYPEIYWKSRLCYQCGVCLEVCPIDAINPPISIEESRNENSNYHKIIRRKCDRCMKCVDACPYKALSVTGTPMTIDEIIDEVLKDKLFYDNSGGGMTLSGGEPTFHPEFSNKLLKAARSIGLNNCIDTNGYCEWEVLKSLAENTDVVLFDLKHIDSDSHKRGTGASNEIILKNLSLLVKTGIEIWIRIPVIPGYNDSMDFHKAASEFLYSLPRKVARIDLIPFHNYCQDKYNWLGIDWQLKNEEVIEPSFMEIPADFYREKGFATTIGGSGFENTAT
jgi:pyruvate formate lyase activating enzyme